MDASQVLKLYAENEFEGNVVFVEASLVRVPVEGLGLVVIELKEFERDGEIVAAGYWPEKDILFVRR